MNPLTRAGAAVAMAVAAGALIASQASAVNGCGLQVVDGTTYLVGSEANLRLLSASCNPTYNVRQTADIDLSSGGPFTPIGTEGAPFSGVYDGRGHSITGLSVTGGMRSAGLFGFTGGAAIRDLSVTGSVNPGPDPSNPSSSSVYAAVLAGSAEATTITGVRVAGSATRTQGSAAGLVGRAVETLTISRSSSTARVTAANSGGLMGIFDNGRVFSITDSYATGVVTGSQYAGGIVVEDATGAIAISNTYFAGRLAAVPGTTPRTGGIVGSTEISYASIGALATLPTAIWNIDLLGSAGAASGAGVGMTTAQMTDIATYRSLGFSIVNGWEAAGSSIWGICPQVNDGYPFLQGHTSSAACAAPASPAAAPAALAARGVSLQRRVTSGTTLRLGLRVANAGGTAAQGATACITAPKGLTLLKTKGAKTRGRTACFAVGALAPGATASRAVTVRASATRRRTVTVTGHATAAGLAKVVAAPVRVRILKARAARA